MKQETTITFVKREDYFQYGMNDAKNNVLDTSYCRVSEDARLSYMAGWSSIEVDPKNIQLI